MGTTTTNLFYSTLVPRDEDLPRFDADPVRDDAEDTPWNDRRGRLPHGLYEVFARARNDPNAFFRDVPLDDPRVCLAFCEHGEGRLANGRSGTLRDMDLAQMLATTANDPHAENAFVGYKALVLQANGDAARAVQVLRRNRSKAFDCCLHCAVDWLRQASELLVRSDVDGAVEFALKALQQADALGGGRDPEMRARLERTYAVAYDVAGERHQAVEAAGRALLALPRDTPEDVALAVIRHLAGVLAEGDAEDDAAAFAILERCEQSLRETLAWNAVCHEYRWLLGQLGIRLGDVQAGRERLDRLASSRVGDGKMVDDVALRLDLVLFHSRRNHPANVNAAAHLLRGALARRDLPEWLREALDELRTSVRRRPESFYEEAAGLRRNLGAHLPSLLAARPPETWCADRE